MTDGDPLPAAGDYSVILDEAQPVVPERFELVYTDRDAVRGDNG